MTALFLFPAFVMAATFALAGAAKLSKMRVFSTELVDLGIPAALAPALAILLPVVEISVAIALIPGDSARWAAFAALALLTVFTAVLVDARRRGFSDSCNCFGALAVAAGGRQALLRNGALASFCVLAAWFDGRGAEAISPAARAAAIGIVLAIAVLALQLRRRGWWASRAALEHGGDIPVHLFESLNGETIDLRRSERRTLLLFWTPDCAPCQYMLPRLRAWESAPPEGAPQLVIVADGSAEAQRSAGLQSPISLDPSSRIFRAFGVPGRPAAVVIDHGTTFNSAPILGAPAILAALGAPP
jgi:uncharacterized membrane protein YphA (DoxX/SURF4 family)/thiol-disulfide isomerase/thioredoxin